MNLARSPLLIVPRRKKTDRSQRSAFPPETSRFAPLIIAYRGSALPWLVDDGAALRLRRIWCVLTRPTRLSATVPPASRVPPPPEGHKLELRRETHLVNTILNQPYRRHVSTNRLNREDSQLTASLEGEPGPKSAENTPHTHTSKPEVSQGEGTRNIGCECNNVMSGENAPPRGTPPPHLCLDRS